MFKTISAVGFVLACISQVSAKNCPEAHEVGSWMTDQLYGKIEKKFNVSSAIFDGFNNLTLTEKEHECEYKNGNTKILTLLK